MRLRHETENRYQATHQWADDIEEAEGQIYQCRDAEHSALCHTAGSPRHEYGGDRGRIFRATAQQLWSIATCRIFLLVNGGIHDDAEELVAHHQVEQYARCHGGANERHGAVDALQENVGDGVEHVARHHARAETHGAKDEPDGIEHTCHASCGNQVVDGGKACIHLRLGVTSNHDSLEKTLLSYLFFFMLMNSLKKMLCSLKKQGDEWDGDDGA